MLCWLLLGNRLLGKNSKIPILVYCEKNESQGALSLSDMAILMKIGDLGSPYTFVRFSAETGDGLIEDLERLNRAMNGSIALPSKERQIVQSFQRSS